MSDSEEFITTVIKRPFIPFCQPIEGIVDTSVTVKGRVPRFANQFAINFIVGQQMRDYTRDYADIALQFNPRFDDEGMVSNNTRIRNYWGIEEKHRNEFPFARNQWFEVKFVFKPSFIKIIVDEKQFALYLHRIPIRHIGMFSIEGDVEVESVVMDRESGNRRIEPKVKPRSKRMITNGEEKAMVRSTPSRCLSEAEIKQQIDQNFNIYVSQHSIVDNMVLSQKTIYNPPMPFSQKIFNGLKSGMNIIINGQTMDSPKELNICLQCEPTSSKLADIALNMRVVFANNHIIRKCRIDGQWLHHESDVQYFPFKNNKSNQNFELKIEINGKFKIYFNGIYFFDYQSLIKDFKSSNIIEINGDINLNFVKFDALEVN